MLPPEIDISAGSAEQILWHDGLLSGISFEEGRRMVLNVQLALEPDHPHYTGKRSNEARCWHRARVVFNDYRLSNEARTTILMEQDPDGEGGLGDFYGIYKDEQGRFVIHGSSDDISVYASSAAVIFDH